MTPIFITDFFRVSVNRKLGKEGYSTFKNGQKNPRSSERGFYNGINAD